VTSLDKHDEVNARLIAALRELIPMGDALIRAGKAFNNREPWMVAQEEACAASLARAREAIRLATEEGKWRDDNDS
jgi:hypothetical protein